jgi:hypothetical protein
MMDNDYSGLRIKVVYQDEDQRDVDILEGCQQRVWKLSEDVSVPAIMDKSNQ